MTVKKGEFLNFAFCKKWWRRIVLRPSYRFSARCFLTSTTRGKPRDPPLAQKNFWFFPRLDEKMMEKDFLHPPIHRWSHIFRPSPRSIDSLNKKQQIRWMEKKRKSTQITHFLSLERMFLGYKISPSSLKEVCKIQRSTRKNWSFNFKTALDEYFNRFQKNECFLFLDTKNT